VRNKIQIRGNKNISGIKVTETEHKLSQFTDDTSLILDGDFPVLHFLPVFDFISHFYQL
jgi:hypothetical protein